MPGGGLLSAYAGLKIPHPHCVTFEGQYIQHASKVQFSCFQLTQQIQKNFLCSIQSSDGCNNYYGHATNLCSERKSVFII